MVNGGIAMYDAIRLCICVVLFLILTALLSHNGYKARKLRIIVALGCMLLCAVLHMAPVENLFIQFKAPEDVFSYTTIGTVEDILYGEDSCMVSYSTSKNSYSYCFVGYTDHGYKIMTEFDQKKVFHEFGAYGDYVVYHIANSDDWYVLITGAPDNSLIDVYDSNDRLVEHSISGIEGTDFSCLYINEYSDDYYLAVDDVRIPLG